MPKIISLTLIVFYLLSTPLIAGDKVEEIEWDSLIPPDWRPEKLLNDFDVDDISDDDPRAKELMEKLKALWAEAPVVEEMNDRKVKIPGFVVPVEMGEKNIREFLLVPYYGACIHVPPPPANQTIYAETPSGTPFKGDLFDAVWVTGTLKVESTSSELAEAGYKLENVKVEPYE